MPLVFACIVAIVGPLVIAAIVALIGAAGAGGMGR